MIIDRDLNKYCIFSEMSLSDALTKIENNRLGIVFALDPRGVLVGVLTDGDIRRTYLNNQSIDLQRPVDFYLNKNCRVAQADDSIEKISSILSQQITHVPLVNRQHKVVAIATQRELHSGFSIQGVSIGDESPVFVIAEIGLNHNGSLTRAKKLVDAAEAAGVDSVKFQMRNLEALYRDTGKAGGDEDLSVQYTRQLLERFELPVEDMLLLFDYVKSKNLIPICTPWDLESLEILDGYDIPAFKVASADLTNHQLLKEMALKHRPMIISTGMSTEDEVLDSVALLKRHGGSYALLHCNSTYPAPFKDINLRYMARLKQLGQCAVGYSGHERGISVAIAATGLGANIIERHLTLDKSLEGSDHRASLLPQEFADMVQGIRQVEQALGDAKARALSQGEVMNRVNLAKSLIATQAIAVGSIIEKNMIEIRSPGRGLQPNKIVELIGKTAKRVINKGDFFFASDLEEVSTQARDYSFNRPWGLTVRWHDMNEIQKKSNPDFIEFHLSYKDMEGDYLSYFSEKSHLKLKVHSPDVFEGDHLLDLSNPDETYRSRSIKELQRVINLTRALKPFFDCTEPPVIIASLGGFSSDRHLSAAEVQQRYALMADSLSRLDRDGVEVVGQTLPPFPWYFGGQLYLNLFVHAEDTVAFCKKNQLRLCFDISHSKLACNYFKESFKKYVDYIAPYVAHIHFGDASGVDGEGLQIGDGDIDYPALVEQLDELCGGASFIPEIWNGHKNGGEGFWVALERLEKLFNENDK